MAETNGTDPWTERQWELAKREVGGALQDVRQARKAVARALSRLEEQAEVAAAAGERVPGMDAMEELAARATDLNEELEEADGELEALVADLRDLTLWCGHGGQEPEEPEHPLESAGE